MDSIIDSIHFTDCGEYAEHLKHAEIEIIQTSKGVLSGSLYYLDLPELDLQFGYIKGASVLETGTSSREQFSFLYDLNHQMPTITNGYEINKYSFTFYPPNQEHHSLSYGDSFWAYVCLKNSDNLLKKIGAIKPPATPIMLTCSDIETVVNMHYLIYQIAKMAQNTPHYYNDPVIRQYVGNELMNSQIDLLMKSYNVKKKPGSRERNRMIVSNFIEYTKFSKYSKQNILNFCSDYGISLRTIYYAFDDIYKMSPYKYNKLYRLNMAHRKLLKSDPNTNSIWKIAMQNKFYHLGRFSAYYKKLFDKSPSEVLKNCNELDNRS